jgi:hypothetical protein
VLEEMALEQVYLQVYSFSPANFYSTISPTHLSPASEACENPDQAAHYHISVAGASSLRLERLSPLGTAASTCLL